MIAGLFRLAFLWWWEKNIEKHLSYYQAPKDATKVLQWHFDRAVRGSTTRHTANHVLRFPSYTFSVKSPIVHGQRGGE